MRECDSMLREDELQKNKEFRIDKIISVAIMSSFIVLTLQYFILISFSLSGTSSAYFVQMLSKIIVGLIFSLALPYVLKRKLKLFILLYGFGVVVFGYNFLVFPENHSYLINLIFPFFFMALPSFIYVLSLRNLEVFKLITEKIAFIIFILGTFLWILIFTGNAIAGVYSMSLSYYMLLPALVFLGKVFEGNKPVFIIYFLIALMVILAFGSRGALLCITIYVILRVASPKQKFSSTKILIYGVAGIILVISILNYERILLYINKMFLEYGIQSRTINLLLQDEVSLSGRDSIVQTVWNEIILSPILGIGVAGDFRIIEGSYVHNFIIEVMGNFGIPVGILLLGFLMLILVTTISFSKNYNLIALWISLGFVHLMMSSSYIIDVKFWIFFGILILSLGELINNKSKEHLN